MWVILRPGPYCCAECEFGGFPWWWLKEPHAHVGTGGVVSETAWMLTNNVPFCHYMIHSGTSFGFMNGANFGGRFQALIAQSIWRGDVATTALSTSVKRWN